MICIVAVRPRVLDAGLVDPFVIATTRLDTVRNVAVEVELSDGTRGYGEVPVLHPVTVETTASAWEGVETGGPALIGLDPSDPAHIAEVVAEALPGSAATAAALEQGVWDAWARHLRVPLHTLFGGAGAAVQTDITVPIGQPERAGQLAAEWRGRGFDVLKIKVGHDVADDLERLRSIARGHPEASWILDGNEGWTAEQTLDLLAHLAREGLRPALLEQPVRRDDVEGMARLVREAGVPIAADETCQGPDDVARIARDRLAHVVNLKLSKSGVYEGLRLIEAARTHRLGLMVGGMVETRIGMGFAAHLVSGVGGFTWIDLDTPLLMSDDPVLGGTLLEGPVWRPDLVVAGHGGAPG